MVNVNMMDAIVVALQLEIFDVMKIHHQAGLFVPLLA